MKAYLVLYNALSCAGWAYVFSIFVNSYLENDTPKQFYDKVELPLQAVQTAAALEILHSLLGLVRSPLLTTIIQVSSRLIVLWGYAVPSVPSQSHWGIYLMVASWAFVEIFRYSFYVVNLLVESADKIPYPLFWLRYSLFMVLYPTGISGEILTMVNALPLLESSCALGYRVTLVLLATYPFGGPFMIWTMWVTRKRAFQNRDRGAAPARPPSGISWPVTDAKSGDRSTTKTNKDIWAASVKSVPDVARLVERERNWRFKYNKHVETHVRASLASPEAAIKIAQDGLRAAQDAFEFIDGGKAVSLGEAMREGAFKGSYRTAEIKGRLAKPAKFEAVVPYGGSQRQSNGAPRPYYSYRTDETELSGKKLVEQLDTWVKWGTIEQSAADAIKACVDNPKWLDLSDHTFVLLGATSAMGPLEFLLRHGANIVAVDLNRNFIWEKLIKRVQNSCGRMIFPYTSDKDIDPESNDMYNAAGANLLSDTPRIANWLCGLKYPTPGVTIGNYTYLDGALHVQLSVACDAIIDRLCHSHKNTSIAFLCTPTDTHVIPEDASKEMSKNYNNSPLWLKALRALGFGKILVKNALQPVKTAGGNLYIVDGIVTAQGPNYALAKRIQHWRAIVARENGHVVGSNVAPSTATKSVVSNAQFAAAYGGFHLIKPMEVMFQETSHAVMGCILIHDIRNPKAPSHPSYKLVNPLERFKFGAFHGGISRCGYKIDSIGEVCAVVYYLKQFAPHIVLGVSGLATLSHWIVTGNYSPF